MYIYIHNCICTHRCIFICMYANTYIYMYIHTYVYMYIFINCRALFVNCKALLTEYRALWILRIPLTWCHLSKNADDIAAATHCNTLQHTAMHCKTHSKPHVRCWKTSTTSSPRHIAAHCNNCNELYTSWFLLTNANDIATDTHCNTVQHTASHCIALQHYAPRFLCWKTPTTSLPQAAHVRREFVRLFVCVCVCRRPGWKGHPCAGWSQFSKISSIVI